MAKAQWRWGDVLQSVTGRPINDNVLRIKHRPTIDELCDDLDIAKDKLVAHINAVPELRENVRKLQHELAERLDERDTGIEWTIQALPTIDLESLEMTDRPDSPPED